MIEALIVLLIIAFLAIAYGAGRLYQWILLIEQERQQKNRLSNWAIAGLEDVQAIDIDVLLWIRDALMIMEGRIQDRMNLIGQIRSGDYDKDQPAVPRDDGR